jgi:hypothetical protein
MTYQAGTISDDQTSLPQLPDWVISGCAETVENVAFLSGAALSHLHLVVGHPGVPQSLLRERLALGAAEACMVRAGRPERAGDLRDAVGFLQPEDTPGPAGEVFLSWRRAVERPVSVKALHRALPTLAPEQIADWLDGRGPRGAGQGGPVARSAAILETVLAEKPREEVAALILADAVLAQSLGWKHLVLVASSVETTRLAADLARRGGRLQAVAPILRAKGAGAAVALLLEHDSVAPAALTSLSSDRAARRFCDRLVELGVARELTGRDTFRLYGL